MNALDGLVEELTRLPGIGRKTARRLAYYLVKRSNDGPRRLAGALERVADQVGPCGECGNLSDADPCEYCRDPRRDAATVCVVEEASDISAIERSGRFGGLYHVLGGRLSPLDGVGPDDLNVARLEERVAGGVAEVIVATNPSIEGEATAAYLRRLLETRPAVKVTRPAQGLPVGGDLEYADGVTIGEALVGRREMQ